MGHLISRIVPLLLVWSNSGPDSPFAGTHLRVARERKRARTFMRALLANVLVMATQALVVSGSLLGLFRRAAPVRELGRQDVCPPQYFGHTLLCSTPEVSHNAHWCARSRLHAAYRQAERSLSGAAAPEMGAAAPEMGAAAPITDPIRISLSAARGRVRARACTARLDAPSAGRRPRASALCAHS
jgi:hypothetical protein